MYQATKIDAADFDKNRHPAIQLINAMWYVKLQVDRTMSCLSGSLRLRFFSTRIL